MFIHTQTRALFVGVAFSAIRGPNSTLHTHINRGALARICDADLSNGVYLPPSQKCGRGDSTLLCACCVNVQKIHGAI